MLYNLALVFAALACIPASNYELCRCRLYRALLVPQLLPKLNLRSWQALSQTSRSATCSR